MAASDLASLKAYVLGPSSQNKAEDTVVLSVSHSNLKQQFAEIRFDLHTTVERVKERLRSHTGTAVDSMRLELFDQNNSQLAVLSDEWRPLGYYSPRDGYRIHVVDTDPISLSAGGWLEDTSLVKKFELTDEEYNNRADTYRNFKKEKIARDPSWSLQKELAQRRGDGSPATQPITDEYMAEHARAMKVGDRCEVDPGAKRGQVAYVGCVASLPPGFWIGVHYDEPVGKHDGMVKGEQLFKCPFGHGSFLRPDRVKMSLIRLEELFQKQFWMVGDYSERNPFDDDDPDEI